MKISSVKTAKKGTFRHSEFYIFRTMRHGYITFILLLGICSAASSQSGRVSIEQDPEIGKLLAIYSKSNAEGNYFTIQVGFGTYNTAQTLKDDVEVDFPQWTAKIVFDSPTYRVQVGRFRDRLEAEREFLEVRKKYPGALLLKPGDR